jgi:hypothetical protein
LLIEGGVQCIRLLSALLTGPLMMAAMIVMMPNLAPARISLARPSIPVVSACAARGLGNGSMRTVPDVEIQQAL